MRSAARKLLSNYYSDIRFDLDVYKLAAQLDGQHPGGAAHALSRAAARAEPEATFVFVQHTLRSVDAADPHDVRVWCGHTANGLLAVAAGNEEARNNNLFILLARVITDSWCSPPVLPFVLEGIRDAMRRSEAEPLRDPLEAVLRPIHQAAVTQLGETRARAYLLGLIAQCRPEDKQTAARVILTVPRR